ncbi:MAG TPA: hypothetical protein VGB81_11390, partial [Devosia sp.]
MADYKELLRRAISALPENNGAARRAVYEKARSALVGQLRAIQPPLPARDITQHRLQLEDCIRQVEQEASEAIISLGREGGMAARLAPRPAAPSAPPVQEMPPVGPPLASKADSQPTEAELKPVLANNVSEAPRPSSETETPKPTGGKVVSIEDI